MFRNAIKEFQEFILKGSAFDLAVGVIIGAAFSAIVTSLVNDILMPPIGFIMGGIDFSNYYIDLTAALTAAEPAATLSAAEEAGHAIIAYGRFINALINLIIVGFAIFMIVKQINRFRRSEPQPAVPPAPPEDVKLLTEIRDLLARDRTTINPR